ncbi:hypothetical protein [Amycolatopsis sp. EV170708-02-1]|uniref:hypothetical protein n=1 Tax=Amycolatopsis sp. EV170708-02-1 TaxID=2919322 RepID=UPI001F0C0CDD|nr:hypothetical protein [Amycolatopsis sp. EV170708-02-1]UMP06511.1 hypothetical protein MJQ72_17625 [Amycolatopsis sp. EV170708-02-1]
MPEDPLSEPGRQAGSAVTLSAVFRSGAKASPDGGDGRQAVPMPAEGQGEGNDDPESDDLRATRSTTIGDSNGSKIGRGHVKIPDVTSFRVCEDDAGEDSCSPWRLAR